MAKKAAKTKVAAEPKPANESVRAMSESEIKEMTDLENNPPPEGYSNTPLEESAPAEPKEGTEPPAAPEPPEEEGAEPKDPPAEPATGKAKPKEGEAPAEPEEPFLKLERELAKPEGKEDLSKFTPREKAYYHQMRRDRKARQEAEAARDVSARKILKLENPPPPPPDPLEGLGDDEVLSVKEIKERLAKVPKPAPAEPAQTQPSPAVSQAKHYLVMCEKEARAAHPDDFDAVMELSDLIDGDHAMLKDLSERTAKGENPAEVMYQSIKKHKEFDALLPAAQTRVQARAATPPPATQPAAAAAPPAGPPQPAEPTTPEDKAKQLRAQQAQEALESNGTRPLTTAHASVKEGKPAEELSLEEITTMSDLEFAKLPRHVRQKYLKQHGA